jgi:hypothetical protein
MMMASNLCRMTTPPPPPPPPPPGGPPGGPPGYASSDEKTWALVAHFGGAAGMLFLGAAGGWIAPLIALLVRGNQSPTVRAHSVNALNFQLTWSIVGVIGYLTICILVGVVLVPIAALVGIVFGIIGGVKANDGELYDYPASITMVK